VRRRIRITYAPAVHAVQRPCVDSWNTATVRSYKRALQTLPSVSAEPLSPAADRNVGSLKALVTGFPGVAAPTMPPRLPTLYLTVAAEKARPSQSRPRPFTTLIPSLPPSPCLTRPYTCRTWNIVLVEWNALLEKDQEENEKDSFESPNRERTIKWMTNNLHNGFTSMSCVYSWISF
jgi:hypothetical protein